ncbi:hypothetical protein D9M68_823180 [compost metagenome]
MDELPSMPSSSPCARPKVQMLPDQAAQMNPPATATAPTRSTGVMPWRSANLPVNRPPIPRQTIMSV